MKRIYWGTAILLFLLFASLTGTHYFSGKIDEISRHVERSAEYAGQGDTLRALEEISRAEEKWDALETYTHIFIRHSEIDTTDEAFGEYIFNVLTEDGPAVKISGAALRHCLAELVRMERVSIGSIL